MRARYIGDHANTVFKIDKGDEIKNVPISPGDFVDLTDKDAALDDNKALFSHNLLMEVKDK